MEDVPSAASGRGQGEGLAFVDLETTGGDARHHRVIEVGVIELDADGTTRGWSTLVNPGCRVPLHIEQFTGISNEMVADAPPFAAVAGEIGRRLAGRLLVAHNARFDYGFLRQEFDRLGQRFRADVLCTVKLSRLLYPEAVRHNLDVVMQRHGLSTTSRHRALGDARVLYELWQVLKERWPAARLHEAVAQLSRRTTLPEQLPPELADDLPDAPGIYRFTGEDNALLYIGKAKSIRARVLGHFAAAAGGGKDAKLARLVRRVEWTETVGDLGALLLEAQLIKSERPIFNRRARASNALHAIELSLASGWLRAQVVPFGAGGPGVTECFGIFRKRADAERAFAEIMRSNQLCSKRLGREAGDGSCFGYQVGRCRGACVGLETPERHNLRLQMALASLRIAAWPFAGAIAVTERGPAGQRRAYLFDRWCYLGATELGAAHSDERGHDNGRDNGDNNSDAAVRQLVERDRNVFDPDIYRLLRRFLAHAPRHAIRELSTATLDAE
jgi:DNA polymerase III subunit epsilon